MAIAQAALGISGLPNFLSGQSVLRFAEQVKVDVESRLKDAQRLRAALEKRAADFGITGQEFERPYKNLRGCWLMEKVRFVVHD